jgi:ankyrin repeat protein
MFRFNFAAEMWISATELSPWKLMPYPKFIEDGATESISTPYGTAKTCDSSMAYHHVDICYPIAARNVPMIKMCLDQGVDVNAPLPGAKISGTTPLMKAVATAYEYTPYDTIATMLLMRRDARKVVQLLLHHGADPDWKDDRGMSARDWSEYPLNPKFHSRPDWLIQQLLKHDPHPDFNHLLELTDAVWAGQIEKLESLLVKDSELLHLLEHHDVSPLGAAVYRRDEIMVNMLLDNGVSPGCLDSIGSSPLAIAVVTASEDMAHILMQRGADLNLTDPVLGVSPLEYAAREGMLDICRTLIRYPKNQSPLNVAELWNGEPGHQPNHQFSKPLALAVRRYHPDIVVLLLDHGADVFMDMRPFLQPGELPAEGIHAVTPRSFVERKIHTRHYNSEATPASRRILAILKQYEKRFRRKDSDEADVENLDDGWEAQREEGRSKRRYETTVAPSKPGFFGF